MNYDKVLQEVKKDLETSQSLKKVMENEKVTNIFMDSYITSDFLDKNYEKGSILMIGVPSEIIQNKDTKYVTSYYDAILNSNNGKYCKCVISTSAYDNDTREVYKIPEYVEYIKSVFDEVPALFSLMDIENMTWLIIMYSQTGILVDSGLTQKASCNPLLVKKFALNVAREMKKDNRFTDQERWRFKDEFFRITGIEV